MTILTHPSFKRWLGSTLSLLLLAFLAVGCDDSSLTGPDDDPDSASFTYTFEESQEGWTGAFSDYSTSKTESDLDLVFDRRTLPDEVNDETFGLYLAGTNESDDLFMFLKRELTALAPNTTYQVRYQMEVASNAPSGCVGIGGPPGESVYMKAGAAAVEPMPVAQEGDFRLNVDKSNQASSGDDAIVIGTIENGVTECTGTPYRLISFDSRNADDAPLTATTDEAGSLWVFVGTDSGFEGRTALYYDSITITLEPVE